MTHGRDRNEAIDRMQRALCETVIGGLPTTVEFLRSVLADPIFRMGEIHTDYIAGLS
jgi:acetyl/propionyl-CoA carboxylase alpha subunit